MLLNILRCTGRPPQQNVWPQMAISAKVEKLWFLLISWWPHLIPVFKDTICRWFSDLCFHSRSFAPNSDLYIQPTYSTSPLECLIYLKLLLLQPFPSQRVATVLLVPRARNLGDYSFHTLYPVHKSTSWHLHCYQTGTSYFYLSLGLL